MAQRTRTKLAKELKDDT